MLDPSKTQPIDLKDLSSYINSCLQIAADRLKDFAGPREVAGAEDELNRYPRLGSLEEPQDLLVVDESELSDKDRQRAARTLLEGGVLLEHACAGEATRLGLGTKYLINPRLDLSPKVLEDLLGGGAQPPVDTAAMRSMSLGRRHMLQLAWDISKLAEEAGQDPDKALKRQTLFVILNEASFQPILEDFIEAGFYGFSRARVFFMVQKSFHGITKKKGRWVYDTASPRRLHNHGQMMMQSTMDNQVFRLDKQSRYIHYTWAEFRQVVSEFEDKVSFNIEDLNYLNQSLDLTGLAVALKLSDTGARMVMEVVANNPEAPQKGGLCAWDPKLKSNVMVESFQLAGMANKDITFLNRNFNHYPRPAQALTAVREQGLSMPLAVKNGYLYFQPVQGDANFLVPTAFFRRKVLKPISAWKAGDTTIPALLAMADQEKRPGFLKWAQEITGLSL